MKRPNDSEKRMNSVIAPFIHAREVLGVDEKADARTIKRAYRTLVADHPPDRDPDGFRRIRDAYELLTDPLERAEAILMSPTPYADFPPSKETVVLAPGQLALMALRAHVATLDAADLLGENNS